VLLIVSLFPRSKTEITNDSDPVVEEITLDEGVFSALKQKSVELGTPMEEMWRLVMPESSDMLHGFGGKPETMTNLKELLQCQTTEALRESDRSWARDALDKALNPQQTILHLSSTGHQSRLKLPEEGWGDEPESSDDKPDDPHAPTLIFGPDSMYQGTRVADIISHLSRLPGFRVPDPRPHDFPIYYRPE
jgi:hypothetical protein